MRSDREKIDVDNRAVARAIGANLPRLRAERGAGDPRRWPNACAWAAIAAFGSVLWFGGGSRDLPLEPEIVLQPSAASSPLALRSRGLTGVSNESLENSDSDSAGMTREERAERRKARKEAARAKREAARDLRASAAQERREARKAKYDAARERRAEAAQARREAAEERREASKAGHEDAHDRYAAAAQARREAAEERRAASKAKREAAHARRLEAMQAKRDAAEARREAARQKREMALARREGAGSESPEPMPESTSMGSGAWSMTGGTTSGSSNAGTLRINSLPWAQVFIDGRMVGYTPQRGISLKPGDHDVRLVNSSFGMTKALRVRIAKGQQVTRHEILEERD